jgi:hypothetical protein
VAALEINTLVSVGCGTQPDPSALCSLLVADPHSIRPPSSSSAVGHTVTQTSESLRRIVPLEVANYNQVEEDEMGGPCSTNGGEEERL